MCQLLSNVRPATSQANDGDSGAAENCIAIRAKKALSLQTKTRLHCHLFHVHLIGESTNTKSLMSIGSA
jgi:hypothetical protein